MSSASMGASRLSSGTHLSTPRSFLGESHGSFTLAKERLKQESTTRARASGCISYKSDIIHITVVARSMCFAGVRLNVTGVTNVEVARLLVDGGNPRSWQQSFLV